MAIPEPGPLFVKIDDDFDEVYEDFLEATITTKNED